MKNSQKTVKIGLILLLGAMAFIQLPLQAGRGYKPIVPAAKTSSWFSMSSILSTLAVVVTAYIGYEFFNYCCNPTVKKNKGPKKQHNPKRSKMNDSNTSKAVDVIEFYEKDKPYYEFTNFYQGNPITVDGQQWKTSEHYFQAQKFIGFNSWLQSFIQDAATPRAAFDLARQNNDKKRADWESAKDNIMLNVLKAKFSQDEKLKKLLLSTNDALLVEASDKDSYWGHGPAKRGQNKLGLFLMKVREELKK